MSSLTEDAMKKSETAEVAHSSVVLLPRFPDSQIGSNDEIDQKKLFTLDITREGFVDPSNMMLSCCITKDALGSTLILPRPPELTNVTPVPLMLHEFP